MATQAAVKTDKKRADGPVKISYLTTDGKEHDRVPTDVKGIKVIQRSDNKSKVYDLTKFSPAILLQLAGQSFVKRGDVGSRNAVKADANASVINVFDELFTNLVAGKFSARGEGKGGPGRTFDIDMWVRIFEIAYTDKRKANPKLSAWGDKQVNAIKLKLESMDGKARNKYLNELAQKDPVFNLAKMTYKTEQAKVAVKAGKGSDAFADLF